jgi:hypothetical protein
MPNTTQAPPYVDLEQDLGPNTSTSRMTLALRCQLGCQASLRSFVDVL